MKQCVALVPMRHHSQRVPGKNYRLIAGKPLFHYIIETLLSVPEVDQIVVDTDSTEIMEGLRKNFPQVIIVERPEHLRADTVPMNEVLLYDVTQVSAEFYLQTHSTNPLLRADTISRAIQALLRDFPSFDSLFSVTRRHVRFWDQLSRPINHNPSILLQTQDLPPVFEENSCMYIFTPQTLLTRRNRLGERPLMFEMPEREAMDIDDEIDFELADTILSSRGK